jgi:hypothetical protein
MLHATHINRKLTSDGVVIGSRVLKHTELDVISDIRAGQARIKALLESAESTISDAISKSIDETRASVAQATAVDILARYAERSFLIEETIKNVAQRIAEATATALELSLTDEQIASVLGNEIVAQLPAEALPSVAVRIHPTLQPAFEAWISSECPANLRAKVRTFPHDNVPENHLVIRTDTTVSELALRPLLVRAAQTAAVSVSELLRLQTLHNRVTN